MRQDSIPTNSSKFDVFDSSHALYLVSSFGPAFGSYIGSYYCDIEVGLDSGNNYADFGASYNLPSGYSWGSAASRSYLTGAYTAWTTSEIEVYQIF